MSDKILNIFKQHKPNLIVCSIVKLTDDEYVVEAVRTLKHKDYNNPFYKVVPSNNSVTGYFPIEDLDRFIEATEKSMIYKRK